MRIEAVNFLHGGLSLEVVAETTVETALLRQVFEHGKMSRGNGKSLNADGTHTGFFLDLTLPAPPAEDTP